MAVSLEFYLYDKSSKLKAKIGDNLDIGSLFKGDVKKVPIAIYNAGTTTAVSPKISIAQYYQEGANFAEAVTWKTLSLDEMSNNYTTTLQLPDILPGSWMSGKDIYTEDFSGYSTAAGTMLDGGQWDTFDAPDQVWEVYAQYLRKNADMTVGMAKWKTLPMAKDFEFSTRITVRDEVFAGYLVRDTGDSNTGYIVLVQGQSQFFGSTIPTNQGVIQVYTGKFTDYDAYGYSKWTLLYQSPSIGVRGTHDYFKLKVSSPSNGVKFEFWYQNEGDPNPRYAYTDTSSRYTSASIPILLSHALTGGIQTYFDEIRYEIPNQNGLVWIKDAVNQSTPLFGRQYSVFKCEYGGV